MTVSTKNSPLKSDLAKVEAHVVQQKEYDEVPELTGDMVAHGTFKKAGKLVSADVGKAAMSLRLRGRPKVEQPKQTVAIRLSADLLAALRATGKGWQTRAEETLRRSLGL